MGGSVGTGYGVGWCTGYWGTGHRVQGHWPQYGTTGLNTGSILVNMAKYWSVWLNTGLILVKMAKYWSNTGLILVKMAKYWSKWLNTGQNG